MRTATTRIVILVMLIMGISEWTNAQQGPSVYIVGRSTGTPKQEAGKDPAMDPGFWAGEMESYLLDAALKRLPCGDVLNESSARAMLEFERQRQLLGSGDEQVLANIAGSIGAKTVMVARTAVTGGKVFVTVSSLDSRTARVTYSAQTSFDADGTGFENAMDFAKQFVSQVPGLRCPCWQGTLTANFTGEGKQDTATVTGSSNIECMLKDPEGMADCTVTSHGTIKRNDPDGSATASTTEGSGSVKIKIEVDVLDTKTIVKVGTFKLKRKTSLTMTYPLVKRGFKTEGFSTETEDEDGGWEFESPSSPGNTQSGSWTSPEGFLNGT